jgi:hypothetical protein
MKKLNVINFALLLTLLVAVLACNKSKLSENVESTKIEPSKYMLDYGELAIRIRKGTRLHSDCHGTLPCGPCPGICIRRHAFLLPNVVDPLTQQQIDEGDFRSTFQLTSNNDSLKIVFIDDEYIETSTGQSEIEDDFPIGPEVSNALGYGHVIIKKGVYNLQLNSQNYRYITVGIIH